MAILYLLKNSAIDNCFTENKDPGTRHDDAFENKDPGSRHDDAFENKDPGSRHDDAFVNPILIDSVKNQVKLIAYSTTHNGRPLQPCKSEPQHR